MQSYELTTERKVLVSARDEDAAVKIVKGFLGGSSWKEGVDNELGPFSIRIYPGGVTKTRYASNKEATYGE
jgi:hypothetical protein